MLKLDIHLHQRLLHVLNVSCGIIDQPFAMAQVGPQSDDAIARTKAPAQQPMLMELLQPLGIVNTGLAAGNIPDLARI